MSAFARHRARITNAAVGVLAGGAVLTTGFVATLAVAPLAAPVTAVLNQTIGSSGGSGSPGPSAIHLLNGTIGGSGGGPSPGPSVFRPLSQTLGGTGGSGSSGGPSAIRLVNQTVGSNGGSGGPQPT